MNGLKAVKAVDAVMLSKHKGFIRAESEVIHDNEQDHFCFMLKKPIGCGEGTMPYPCRVVPRDSVTLLSHGHLFFSLPTFTKQRL